MGNGVTGAGMLDRSEVERDGTGGVPPPVAEERIVPLFRHARFWSGLLDLGYGVIGLFWMIQLVGFGLVYAGCPAFDWAFYQSVGVDRVPLILVSEYFALNLLGFALLFLSWRRFLSPLLEGGEMALRWYMQLLAWVLPYVVLAGWPALRYDWLSTYTWGVPTKLMTTFVSIPLSGICLGAFLGRMLVLFRLMRTKDLLIVERRYRGSFKYSLRILAVPRVEK